MKNFLVFFCFILGVIALVGSIFIFVQKIPQRQKELNEISIIQNKQKINERVKRVEQETPDGYKLLMIKIVHSPYGDVQGIYIKDDSTTKTAEKGTE